MQGLPGQQLMLFSTGYRHSHFAKGETRAQGA